MNSRFSSLLNFSRWSAALLVVAGHLRNIVFIDYAGVQQKTLIVKAFYFFTGLGHEAVIVFFVISGFLVGGTSYNRWKSKTFDYTSYFTHRFSRIYIVLLPALLMGGILDFIGLHFFNLSGLYTNTMRFTAATLNFSVKDQLSTESLLGSITMLQPFVSPSFGSNGPLWSLAYEWWYYCLFAILLGLLGSKTWAGKITLAAALIGLSAVLPTELILWMIIWLLGIAVLFCAESRLPKFPPLAAICFFIATIALSKLITKIDGIGVLISFTKDLLIGLGYSALLLSLYNRSEKAGNKENHFLAKVNQHLAEFSYTTYLFHFPFMLLFLAVSADAFNKNLKQQPTASTFFYFFLTLSCIYFYAYLFSRLTERYTNTARQFLDTRLLPMLSSANIRRS